MDELVSTDYVYREPTVGEKRGRTGLHELVTTYRTAFPDLKMTIEEQLSEGDKVVTRWTATGTHRGELFGTAPTGKQVRVQGILVTRITKGKASSDCGARSHERGLTIFRPASSSLLMSKYKKVPSARKLKKSFDNRRLLSTRTFRGARCA